MFFGENIEMLDFIGDNGKVSFHFGSKIVFVRSLLISLFNIIVRSLKVCLFQSH